MGDHVMHSCEVLVPTFTEMNPNPFTKKYGWPYADKIPLNEKAHESGRCPYCGDKLADMERVPPEDAMLLNTNPHASGALRGTAANVAKRENAALKQELNAMRAEFRDIMKEMRKMRETAKKGGSE